MRLAGMLLAFSLTVCTAGAGQAPRHRSAAPVSVLASAAGHGSEQSSMQMAIAERELEQAYKLRQKLTQHDVQTAIRLFADSAGRFSLSRSPQKAALAELEAGDTYQMMSAYQAALTAYRRSMILAPDVPEVQCAALAHLAHGYANIGRNRDAKTFSDRAVTACSTIPDKKSLAYAMEVKGEVEYWSANPSDALTSFTRARQLASEANDRDGEAQSTMMMAQIFHTSDRAQSHRLAQAALALWTEASDDYGAARAHLALAFFAADEGSFGLARCHCEKALPIFHRVSDKDNEAVIRNTLGLVARASGDVEGALDNYRQARKDFLAAEDELGEAESIIGMADALVSQKDYSSLLPLYTRELHLAQATNNRALLASALLSTADVHLHAHRYELAETNYQRSLIESRAGGNTYGAGLAYMRLADLRADQGSYGPALDLLDRARALKEQTSEPEDLAKIAYARARIYLRLNQLERSRSEAEKAIRLIEAQRLRIEKFDSRAQYFAFVHEYYALYLQVLMGLHRLYPGQGYEKLAFEAAEKSKVRALLDLMNDSQETAPCDQLLNANSDPQGDSLAELPDAIPAVASAQALTLSQIQSDISDGQTVLVEYALGENRTYAWLVGSESVAAFDLGATAPIRSMVHAFLEALVPLQPRRDEPALEFLKKRQEAKAARFLLSRQLAERLIGPLHLPAKKRVLIVPDGPLQYLPFAALSVQDVGGSTRPWITRQELSTLPSASVLAVLRKTAAKRLPPKDEVTVFADPVFQGTASAAAGGTQAAFASGGSRSLQHVWRDVTRSQSIPSLPASRTEALAIQRIFGTAHTRLALGFNANRESVLDGSIARQRIVHFATHGIIDTRHPEMSGLVLSLVNKRGQQRDGYLRLSDIYHLKLSADLVVLSSCESALGKDLGSEGIIGLPRGFLYAGARSVIASLWKVDDEASAALMSDLYSRMKQGASPAAALRGAQLDMARGDRFSEPSYWAAFVLEGDYK